MEDSKTKAKDAQPVSPVIQAGTKYSLGLQWNPRLLRDDRYTPTSFDLGYRVIGNAWATAGYDWHTKEVTLGIRLEF